MSQSPYIGARSGGWVGAEWVARANEIDQAWATTHSGATPPPVAGEGMEWLHTPSGIIRRRSPANDAWADQWVWDAASGLYLVMTPHGPIGSAAARDVGTGAGNVVALDSQGRLPAVSGARLIDLPQQTAPVGAIELSMAAAPRPGWLWLDGRGLGTVASGAALSGDDYLPLFSFLWDNVPALTLQTSGGAPATRGASASADWSANKRVLLPDVRGLSLIVDDAMGGTAAGRVPSAVPDYASAGIVGALVGAHTHTLTLAQLPSASRPLAGRAPSDHTGPTSDADAVPELTRATVGTAYTVQNAVALGGSNAAHNTVPRSIVVRVMIKM